MKKLFTLVAMAFMAVCVNAQSITWSEADKCDKGAAQESYSNGELVLTCIDTAKEKHQVEKNGAYFGTADNFVQYKYRFKTNGKSNSKNGLKLTVPSAGELKIAVRTATSSDETRTLILTQNEKEIYNDYLKDSNSEKGTIEGEEKTIFHYITVNVAAGDIAITYPINAINFYAFEFTPASNPGTAIESVKASVENNVKTYNVGGRVATKGLVIKNGKKYVK